MIFSKSINSFLFSFVMLANAVRGELEIYDSMARFYTEAGCTPKSGTSSSPVEFECPSKSLATATACLVEGKSYPVGSEIPSDEASCLAACKCVNGLGEERAQVICAHVECPEHFGRPLQKQGCSLAYDVKKCCSTGFLCEPDTVREQSPTDGTQITYSETPLAKCKIGNETLPEGSKYYPNEAPCSRCVCTKEFDGNAVGPWCMKIKCGSSFHNNKEILNHCAPTFFKSSMCCPIQFRCPVEGDSIIKDSNADSKVEGHQCIFGTLKLNIGDKLSPNNIDGDCSCQIPPYVSCVKTID